MKYRYTNVPSLIQADREEWEAICFLCKRSPCEFHHILNGPVRKVSEQIGAWIWLCPACHRKIHDTSEGRISNIRMKALCQEIYEKDHTREEWMELVHKSYL